MNTIAFLSFLLYAFITAITPGPNNILTLNAVISYPKKEAKILILGICVGFAIVMIVFGFGSAMFGALLPFVVDYLKILGAGYVLYLAMKVAKSSPPPSPVDSSDSLADSKQKDLKATDDTIGFVGGMLLQFVNVKIILYAITIQSSFVLPYYQSFWISGIFVLFSIVIGFFGIFLWAMGGRVFCTFLQKHYKPVKLIMAFLLVLSAVQIVVG